MKKEVEFEGVKYIVRKPNAQDIKDAKVYASVVFGQLVKEGTLSKAYLDSLTKNDELEKKQEEMQEELRKILLKLKKGGYPKLEARKDAIKAHSIRTKILIYMADSISDRTAESMADDAYNEFIMHRCCLNENGSPVYSSSLKYAESIGTDLAEFLYSQMQEILGGGFSLDNFEEIKFLKKYGYMNDKYDLVNEDGLVVDEDFNVVENEDDFTEFTD